jgi:tetratricopeptide (TPR) repeat protein
MKHALRIALVTALIVVMFTPFVEAQRQRVKLIILDNKTNEPVEGVSVVYYKPNRESVKQTKVSDADGIVKMPGVEPGVVVIELTKEGYKNARFNQRIPSSEPWVEFTVGIEKIIREKGVANQTIVDEYTRGLQLAQEGKNEEALAVFLKLIEDYPDIKESYISAATQYNALGEHENAIKMLEQAIKMDTKNTEYMLRMAESYMQLDQTDKATEWYKKILDQNPEDLYSIEKIAMSAYMSDNYDEAIKYYKMAIGIKPDNALPYYYLGNIYYLQDNYPEALDAYTKYSELDPENNMGGLDAAKAAIYDILEKSIKAAIEGQNYDEAIKYCDRALKEQPGNPVPHFYRGNAFFMQEKYQDALNAYSKYTELDPKNTKGKLEDAQDAIESVKKLIADQ